MVEEQKKLVQTTFRELLPCSQVAAELFYKRLFDLDPQLRSMFKVSLKQQESKLMDMLQLAMYGLDYMEQLIPALQRLGERHLVYGVKPEHYETAGTALLWMLEQALEDNFTPEIKAAWQTLYALLADTMLEAAAALELPSQI